MLIFMSSYDVLLTYAYCDYNAFLRYSLLRFIYVEVSPQQCSSMNLAHVKMTFKTLIYPFFQHICYTLTWSTISNWSQPCFYCVQSLGRYQIVSDELIEHRVNREKNNFGVKTLYKLITRILYYVYAPKDISTPK